MENYIWELFVTISCLMVLLSILHIVYIAYCFFKEHYVIAAIVGMLIVFFGD